MIDLSASRSAEDADDNKYSKDHIPDDHSPEQSAASTASAAAIWETWEGASMMIFGFVLPALTLTIAGITCAERIVRLVLKHPLESIAEIALLLLLPFANYFAYTAVRKADKTHAVRLGLLNGAALGTAGFAAAASAASLAFGYPLEVALLSVIGLLSCAVSAHTTWLLRGLAETRLSRNRRLFYSLCGVALSVLTFVAAEARSFGIRAAETLALSTSARDHRAGIEWLRILGSEQDLRMQCADDRTAGLAGVFFRVSRERERALYFEVVGKPYGNSLTDSVFSMSDDYLRRHVVGEQVSDLSLVRSALTANLNPRTLTSTVNWTFVLKNNSFGDREARAEIAVPPGGSVSGLALWINGEERSGRFVAATNTAAVGYSATYINGYGAPVEVTDLGLNRVLVRCSQVRPQSETKIRLSFTERMKPETLETASLTLPRIIAANFDLEGTHNLRLHANQEMKLSIDKYRRIDAADGAKLVEASLTESQLRGTPLMVQVHRQPQRGPFFSPDSIHPGYFVEETLTQVNAVPPDQIVVVIDGSASMNKDLGKIRDCLRAIPRSVNTSVVIAAEGENPEPMPLAQALDKLGKTEFRGGHDNLEAVIKAAETAGDTNRGAVLWIHGPQPSFNEEMYIMAPYIAKPHFYELALDDGYTDTNALFRNHKEIGPFAAVPRAGSLADDLKQFVKRWQPGSFEYVAQFNRVPIPDAGAVLLTGDEAAEVGRLCQREFVYDLLRAGNIAAAAPEAAQAAIVTPVSIATMPAGVMQMGQEGNNDPVKAAQLQSVTNGSVFGALQNPLRTALSQSFNTTVSQLNQLNSYRQTGETTAGSAADSAVHAEQSPEGTIVVGINTAGTVRVNNLANLEAMLNALANTIEVFGLVIGTILLVRGIFLQRCTSVLKTGPIGTAVCGLAFITMALACPGIINWLVASARDANLFC